MRLEQNLSQTVEFLFAETGSYNSHPCWPVNPYVAKAGFELVVLCLPQLPQRWDYRCEPLLLDKHLRFK